MRYSVAVLISVALALAAARPGAAPQGCEYSVSPVFIDLDGAAHTGTITVDTQPGCPWTTITSLWSGGFATTGPFVTLDAAAGRGPATLRYSVAEFRLRSPDDSTMIRQGRIHVRWPTPTAGQDVVITQHGANCKAVFTPKDSWVSSETFGEAGGVGRLEVLAWEFIVGPWYIDSAPDWITFVSPPLKILQFGDSSSLFVVRPNPSTEPRVGTIRTCSGTTLSIHQSGRTARSGMPNVFNDFDGDGKADLAIDRPRAPSTPVPATPTSPEATLFVLRSGNGYRYDGAFSHTSVGFGQFRSGEFDGDTTRDLVLPDAGIRLSSDRYGTLGASTLPYFASGAGPRDLLMADLLGRGKDDFILYDRWTGGWSFLQSSLEWSEATSAFRRLPAGLAGLRWGTFGDVPMAADFDGDRRADFCVWRPSDGRWYLLFSSSTYAYSGQRAYQWGAHGDVPINGDFDGDGRNDLAVYRPANGTWYILQSTQEYHLSSAIAYQWGATDDTPVAADYDGDGRTDIAVWRPSNGTWYLLFSSTNYAYGSARAVQWGNASLGDRPITR